MKMIERRLLQLERDTPAEVQCFIWPAVGEPVDAAVARQFPEGIPENATVIVFRFAEPPDGGRRPDE
jgi:hypothetical protein